MEASSKSILVEKVTLLGSARVRLKFEGGVLLTEYNPVFAHLITHNLFCWSLCAFSQCRAVKFVLMQNLFIKALSVGCPRVRMFKCMGLKYNLGPFHKKLPTSAP
jgi:hypothetical protein